MSERRCALANASARRSNVDHLCDTRHECIHFTSADDLLSAIAPHPLLETETSNPNFVFRGQKCASWKLRPSAFRPDRLQQKKSVAITSISSYQLEGYAEDQVWAEFRLLSSFVEVCD